MAKVAKQMATIAQDPRIAKAAQEVATSAVDAATTVVTSATATGSTVLVSRTKRAVCAASYGEGTWAYYGCLFIPGEGESYSLALPALLVAFLATLAFFLLLCALGSCCCICGSGYIGAYWGARRTGNAPWDFLFPFWSSQPLGTPCHVTQASGQHSPSEDVYSQGWRRKLAEDLADELQRKGKSALRRAAREIGVSDDELTE